MRAGRGDRESQEVAVKTRYVPPKKRGVLIACALSVLLFIAATEAMGQARRGARVIVTMKPGMRVSGELIAVKPAAILLLDPSGKDFSLDLADVHSVLVNRKSKAAQ